MLVAHPTPATPAYSPSHHHTTINSQHICLLLYILCHLLFFIMSKPATVVGIDGSEKAEQALLCELAITLLP